MGSKASSASPNSTNVGSGKSCSSIRARLRALRLRAGGGFNIQWEAQPLTKDGKSRIGPMPWFKGQDNLAYYALQYPNFIVGARCDMAIIWTAWPITPDACQFSVHTLVAEEVLDRPDFETWCKDLEEFFEVVIDEDREMVQSLQNGAGSRMFVPGAMAKAEGPVDHYLNAYLDKMQGPIAS